jgi:hypothetical protein
MPRIRAVRLLLPSFWLSLAAPAVAEPPAAAPPPKPAPAQVGVPHAPLVTSQLARGAIAAALRASGFFVERRTLESLASRARTSAALPEVWLRGSRSTDLSLRLSPTVDDPAHYSELGGAGILLEARLIWHLDRLVFDRDELSVERLKNERADAAAKLSQRVLEALFAWQNARLRGTDPALLPEEREAAWVSAAQAEVTLDVLTAGWFGASHPAP